MTPRRLDTTPYEWARTAGLPATLIGLALLACGDGTGPQEVVEPYAYTVPQETGDGWATGDLRDHGIRIEPFHDLFFFIDNGNLPEIHSVVIVRHDTLVLEEYYPGRSINEQRRVNYQRETLHELHSVTKSFTSALVGIAVDQGLITNVDEQMSAHFPEYTDAFDADTRKHEIRLSHMLSMSTGLYWDEWTYPYYDTRNTHVAMNRSSDQLRFVMEQPVVASPGATFLYNSGISIALGAIVNKVSGMTVGAFAEEYLFGPLGITDYFWWTYSNGTAQTGGGLSLRPRDMAKFGQLYLRGGNWNGTQVVSEAWVRESTRQQVPDREYGYQWWLHEFTVGDQSLDCFAAHGRGGQFIFVFPDIELVAVFNGGNDNSLAGLPLEILTAYVLPAVLE
jgi:CubicO group peptidase (beta-lactamase class C family)